MGAEELVVPQGNETRRNEGNKRSAAVTPEMEDYAKRFLISDRWLKHFNEELDAREKKVLLYLGVFRDDEQHAKTIKALSTFFGEAMSATFERLGRLEREGYVESRGGSRSFDGGKTGRGAEYLLTEKGNGAFRHTVWSLDNAQVREEHLAQPGDIPYFLGGGL